MSFLSRAAKKGVQKQADDAIQSILQAAVKDWMDHNKGHLQKLAGAEINKQVEEIVSGINVTVTLGAKNG